MRVRKCPCIIIISDLFIEEDSIIYYNSLFEVLIFEIQYFNYFNYAYIDTMQYMQ